MKISICILTYNRKKILVKLLNSLLSLRYEKLEIIVTDNYSKDGTGQYVKKMYPEVIYYCTNQNIGVAARNIGLRNASGDLLVTIDDDISGLTDTDLNNLAEYFKLNKSVGALNFRVIDGLTGEVCNWIHHRKSEEYSNKEFLTYEITEGAVAFRKNALESVGLYAEYFFISHEGPDLALRFLNAGYEVKYSDLVSVKHAHADAGRKPWYRYYYDTRNQFYLAVRNLPLAYALHFLMRGSFSILIYSIRDGYVKYWIKGMLDGMIGVKKYKAHRNVLSSATMNRIRHIDKGRPSVIYMVKARLFRKEIRL